MRPHAHYAMLLLTVATACVADPTSVASPARIPANAVASTDPLGNVNRLPAALEQKVGAVRADLTAGGFAVTRGYWTLWDDFDCRYPIQTIGYCFGNNPTAPYGLAIVPQWKDEYWDQRFHHIVTQPRRNMAATFRMDRREALLVIAQMPPPARYFGIQTNVFTREDEFNPSDIIIPRVSADPLLQSILFGGSPDPLRRTMVASIGNATNNVVMKNRTGQQPWGKPGYFLISSDAGLTQAIIDALGRAGVSSSAVFTEPVAPQLVHLGLDRAADDMITYIRYALPEDKVAGDRWRRELPVTILRIRDMSERQYSHPYPIPEYTTRTANYDEAALQTDLGALVNAVRAHWDQPDADVRTFFSAYTYLDLIGQHCLGYPDPTRGPMDCLGDTQDADYQISQSLRLDEDLVVAVLGTLATETGNATYVSVSVNWFPKLVGVLNLDDTDLSGSAAPFAAALQHDARLFYLHYVARDCRGLTPCVEVPTRSVPAGEVIKLIQRNYINPGSTNGPRPDKLRNPIAITFDGRYRPQ